MAKKTINAVFFNGPEGEKGTKPVFSVTLVREKGWPGTAESFQLAAEVVAQKVNKLMIKEYKNQTSEVEND